MNHKVSFVCWWTETSKTRTEPNKEWRIFLTRRGSSTGMPARCWERGPDVMTSNRFCSRIWNRSRKKGESSGRRVAVMMRRRKPSLASRTSRGAVGRFTEFTNKSTSPFQRWEVKGLFFPWTCGSKRTVDLHACSLLLQPDQSLQKRRAAWLENVSFSS